MFKITAALAAFIVSQAVIPPTSSVSVVNNVSITGSDGGALPVSVTQNPLPVSVSQNPLPVSASSLPLPTGASTEATLLRMPGIDGGNIPVSASSLPLPTGAATEATLLRMPGIDGGSVSVSAISLPLPTGAATEATLLRMPGIDGGAQLVSANSWPLPTGAATSANQPALLTSDPGWGDAAPPSRIIFNTNMLSAFGQLMVAQPFYQVGLEFNYSINSDFVSTTTADGGTVTNASSMAVLQTGTNSAGTALLESKSALHYTPGEGLYVSFTMLSTGGAANSQQEAGLGDVVDGYFFGYVGSTFGIIRRVNSVDTFVAQSSWNVDKMDGTGHSGMTLDVSKLNVYKISVAWHGGGPIRYFVYSQTTGRPVLVHFESFTNQNTSPSTLNPTLPLHLRVFNSGNTTNLTMKSASMGAFTEGTVPTEGSLGSTGNTKSVSTEVSLFTIRDDATFQSKTNRVRVRLKHVSYGSGGGTDMIFRLVKNTTLGGTPSFSSVNSNSVVSVDTAGTTLTGGIELWRDRADSSLGNHTDIAPLEIVLNPGDTLTLSCTSSGGATNCIGGLQWVATFTG